MKKLGIIIGILAILAVATYLSKPSDELIREQAKSSLKLFFETQREKIFPNDTLPSNIEYDEEFINQVALTITTRDKLFYKEAIIPYVNFYNQYVIGYGLFGTFFSTKKYRHIKIAKSN